MTRYQQLFKELTLKKQGAFIPFVSLGDPDFHISVNIIKTLIQSGADALELGIPFSDPLADGPKIQNSFKRALNSKISINDCFKIINIIRNQNSKIPIGLLTYANIVFKNKIDLFYSRCAQYNIDSILIADLPIQESLIFRKNASHYNIDQVFICPPNANDKLLKKIAKYSQSYTYLTSRSGVTGNEYFPHNSLEKIIFNLKKYQSAPIIQGFGIFYPDQAKKALLSGANGVISGSIISEMIENNLRNQKELLDQIAYFVRSMKKTMRQ